MSFRTIWRLPAGFERHSPALPVVSLPWAEYRKHAREFGASLGIGRHLKLFWEKKKGG